MSAANWSIEERSDPVIPADSDIDYGDTINAFYCIQAFLQVDVDGTLLEDQVCPKCCGHMTGKGVISLGKMVGKTYVTCEAFRQASAVIRSPVDRPLAFQSVEVCGLRLNWAKRDHRRDMGSVGYLSPLFSKAILGLDSDVCVCDEFILNILCETTLTGTHAAVDHSFDLTVGEIERSVPRLSALRSTLDIHLAWAEPSERNDRRALCLVFIRPGHKHGC